MELNEKNLKNKVLLRLTRHLLAVSSQEGNGDGV